MDYSLQSLRDAFTDPAYKASRKGYKLYAVLLATTLDQQFLAEYLSFFEELHELTGEDVLVMGVQRGDEVRRDQTPVSVRNIGRVATALRHRDDLSDEASDAAETFLKFLLAQTAESYALARFLGIRTDQFPVMVFFEDLERPSRMVVWPLGAMRGRDFTVQLRHLLEEVSERCAWKETRKRPMLEDTVKELAKTELAEYNYSLPVDCRDAAKAIRKPRNELSQYERALEVYEKIDALRAAFEELRATPDLRVPIQNVGETIADIEHKGFGHVIAHAKRWSSRLPDRYLSAAAALKGESLTLGFGLDPLPPREEVVSRIASLTAQIAKFEAEHQAHRIAELAHATAELERVELRIQSAQPVLAAVEDVLRIASCPLAPGTRPKEAFQHQRDRAVRRVFISYSHDSPAHKAEVLALAQQLRADGIDCWIDQFESSPAEGFPRWMRRQVELADMVLLICTPTYRRRFDGAEEAGKGLGGTYEGFLITQEVYDAGTMNRRFIPVLVPGASSSDVPVILRGSKWYEVPSGYDALLRRLMGAEAVEPHLLGVPFSR